MIFNKKAWSWYRKRKTMGTRGIGVRYLFFFFSTQDKHSCFLLHQLSPFCLMQFKSSPPRLLSPHIFLFPIAICIMYNRVLRQIFFVPHLLIHFNFEIIFSPTCSIHCLYESVALKDNTLHIFNISWAFSLPLPGALPLGPGSMKTKRKSRYASVPTALD